jgi:hypothetical protein
LSIINTYYKTPDRGLIRIAPGETRCREELHLYPTTECLPAGEAGLNGKMKFTEYKFDPASPAGRHSVVVGAFITDFAGFHPALITLNHPVVYDIKTQIRIC